MFVCRKLNNFVQTQLFPLFVMQVYGDTPFIPGLFVAGVFSGALSTVSSGLNSLAAVTVQVNNNLNRSFFKYFCEIPVGLGIWLK